MYIFNSVIPTENSGQAPFYSSFQGASNAIKGIRARPKKRLDRRASLEQPFRAQRSFLTRDRRSTGFNKLHGRPRRALNHVSDRLEIYCHQRESAILKRVPFSVVCLVSARTNAAYQNLYAANATTPGIMTKTTFNLMLKIGKPNGKGYFGDIQPLTSQPGVEDSRASFEAADSLKSPHRCRSASTLGATKSIRGPRAIYLDPPSTTLISDSSRDSTFQDTNFHLELSSTSGLGFSLDAEDKSWVGKGSRIDVSVKSNPLLEYKHGSKFVDTEGTSANAKLVESLMEDFWIYFNQKVQSVAAQPETTSNSVTSESNRPEHSSTTITSQGSKRARTDQKGHEADDNGDNDETGRKRPKTASFPHSGEDGCKFACPYRKHDPQKYSVRNWRSCALTPLDTMARVKGHLYRHHRIYQCHRCKQLFKSQEDVKGHVMAQEACELSNAEPVDGITSDIERQLRSRKKSHRDQTEDERWREVYRMIFPNEPIPSPYFEPIREHPLGSPEARELEAYEEYSRNEIPRLFRAALEEIVKAEMQPIEDRLKAQLMNIIQEVQERVFANYRAKANTQGDPGTTISKSTPTYHNDEAIEQILPTVSNTTTLEGFFQPPSPLAGGFHSLDIADRTSDYQASNSDSAYVSGSSTRSAAVINKDSGASSSSRLEMATSRNFEHGIFDGSFAG